MLDDVKKSVLADFRNRKIVSSIMPPEMPEVSLPENERIWRDEHSQRFYCRKVSLLLSGKAFRSLNGKVYIQLPNTLVLINYGELHDCGAPESVPDHYSMDMVIRPSSICCGGYEYVKGEKITDFNYIFNDIAAIKQINDDWYSTVSGDIEPAIGLFCINNHLNLVFESILHDLKQIFRRAHGWTPQIQAIEKARTYIDANCGRHCDIGFLAQMSGFSSMHFQRLFRKHIKMTVKQYINVLRSRRYDEMRLDCPQKVIAEELGFSSAAALCNWLRKGYLGFNN